MPAAAAPAVLLPIQPTPADVCILHEVENGHHSTRIARRWHKGDAARCRLCPRAMCSVSAGGMCLVKIPLYVPDQLAARFPLPAGAGGGIDRVADGG